MISGSGVERGGEQGREVAEQRGRMAETAEAETAEQRRQSGEGRAERERESREPRLGARVGRRGGTG